MTTATICYCCSEGLHVLCADRERSDMNGRWLCHCRTDAHLQIKAACLRNLEHWSID